MVTSPERGHGHSVDRLAHLFREHPAWLAAARVLSADATCTVYFSGSREPWHLEQHERGTRLLPGAATDPDFVFRFTPTAIERLEAVDGGVGDFAVALFSLIVDGEIGFRIVAGFPRLAMRGYLKLLLGAGPPVLAFGAAHGIRTAGALRRLVAEVRSREPADWET